LVENGKPLGGKWSFDAQNRERLPKEVLKPSFLIYENEYVIEAREYIKRFVTVGEGETFFYPTSHEEARGLLELFICEKFHAYGTYQDAIDRSDSPLFHSLISSSLNIGLLDLEEVIELALNADARYNAKEGFIRQIIGWREFMFSLYKRVSVQQRTTNFFGFNQPMNPILRNGHSGIDPLDRVNAKVLHTGYAHHIERLMIQGNWFLLTETDPDEVYRYFMSHTIDAYDWVMVGNVYGMSQYADGGLITTKPYISSSNYLHKMSYYPKNQGWSKLWDALYWRFMFRYSDRFATNPRMKMQRSLLEKMSPNVLREHCNVGDEFIQRLSEF
jgi:deoxyribodipyrimidine photolyase-related protein